MVEEALNKAKEVKTRIMTTIDAFRPKILIKKPLTQIKILGETELAGEGVGSFIKRIQDRIQTVRRTVAFGEDVEETVTHSQVTHVVKKKDITAIHY